MQSFFVYGGELLAPVLNSPRKKHAKRASQLCSHSRKGFCNAWLVLVFVKVRLM